jgi:hypothetical protein
MLGTKPESPLCYKETPMLREYDLFEKFPDGSSLWRACVLGLESTRFYLRELAQKSGNRFYAIDMVSGKIVHYDLERVGLDLLGPRRTGRRSKATAA